MLDNGFGMYSIKNRATIKSASKHKELDEINTQKPNVVTCKLGKVFPSKNKALEYYINEKLSNLGNGSITYYELEKYVGGKVKKDWLKSFGTTLNRFINASDEYVRMDRGRYSKGNALKKVNLDEELLRACISKSDGVLHYIKEFTKTHGYYQWSDVHSYVKKYVPPSWMVTFSNVFSRYTNESESFRKIENGLHYKIFDDIDKPISRDGKEFSNIQEGLRYYIIETLKDGNNYSSSELYEKVKTKVPPNWMRNFSQCIYLSHKNNILQRTIDKNYKLKGVGKEMSGKNNNKLNFVCKNGKHFKNIADGNRYYIEEYFNTYGKGRHHEIRNYIKKHVPIKWLKSFDTVFDRYSKDKANNIVKLSRGLYATEQYNNNNVKQLKLKDEDPVPYNYKDRTNELDNEDTKDVNVENNNNVSNTTNNELTIIKHDIKQRIEQTQQYISEKLDNIDYSNLNKDDLLEVIELKDLIIKLNNLK